MHLRVFTGRALAALARHHGLTVEHAETVGLYPFPPWVARYLTRIDRTHGAFLVQRYTARDGHRAPEASRRAPCDDEHVAAQER
jgi:hypothetical protein